MELDIQIGLKGFAIPYEAQIIRVADEYDAIVSKRQYKTHIGVTDTLKILIENAHNGKNNPRIVKALIALLLMILFMKFPVLIITLITLKSKLNV